METSFNWIMSNINTCTNKFQLDCCATLVELFKRKYGDDSQSMYDELLRILERKQSMVLIEV